MVLSRVFALLLGTTLFILIWTMQDGNHATPRVLAASELRKIMHASPTPVAALEFAPVTVQPSSADEALWMFASEAPEQIAVK